MPEGDTVYRAARTLDNAIAGHVLTASDFRVPKYATVDLTGWTVTGTDTHGKHLLTRIAPPDGGERLTLHTHLKMEGLWQANRTGHPWRRAAHTARVVLHTETHEAIGFSMGFVELRDEAATAEAIAHLGPDPLRADFDADEAVRRLRAASEVKFVEAVLDQGNIAGLGNVFANELAFLSGMHPERPLGDYGDIERLVLRSRQLLEQNKLRVTRTTTGDTRRGRNLWIYGVKHCRRCDTPTQVKWIGKLGQERKTYWCPRCQPAA